MERTILQIMQDQSEQRLAVAVAERIITLPPVHMLGALGALVRFQYYIL
jgi:hypothetical protein